MSNYVMKFFNNDPDSRSVNRDTKASAWKYDREVKTIPVAQLTVPQVSVNHFFLSFALGSGSNTTRLDCLPLTTFIGFVFWPLLTVSRLTSASASNRTIAIVAAGNSTSTDKFTWASVAVAAQSSANISITGYYVTGTANETKMMLYGGSSSIIYNKIDWETLTKTVPSWTLTVARYVGGFASGSDYAIYYSGMVVPYTGTLTASTDKLAWATETCTAQASANLTLSRWFHAACTDRINVFIGGGYNAGQTVGYANTDKMDWATMTTTAGTSFTTTMNNPCAFSDGVNACFTYSTIKQKLNWVTMTPSNVSGTSIVSGWGASATSMGF